MSLGRDLAPALGDLAPLLAALVLLLALAPARGVRQSPWWRLFMRRPQPPRESREGVPTWALVWAGIALVAAAILAALTLRSPPPPPPSPPARSEADEAREELARIHDDAVLETAGSALFLKGQGKPLSDEEIAERIRDAEERMGARAVILRRARSVCRREGCDEVETQAVLDRVASAPQNMTQILYSDESALVALARQARAESAEVSRVSRIGAAGK